MNNSKIQICHLWQKQPFGVISVKEVTQSTKKLVYRNSY